MNAPVRLLANIDAAEMMNALEELDRHLCRARALAEAVDAHLIVYKGVEIDHATMRQMQQLIAEECAAARRWFSVVSTTVPAAGSAG